MLSQAFLWSPSAQKREPEYFGQGHPGQMQLVTGALLPSVFGSLPFAFAFAFGFLPEAFALGFAAAQVWALSSEKPSPQPVPASC